MLTTHVFQKQTTSMGAVSRQSSSFSIANYSPSIAMELEVEAKKLHAKLMTKSEIRDKQICSLSIIFETANSRNKL